MKCFTCDETHDVTVDMHQCHGCQTWYGVVWLDYLAANLAVAGALCKAFSTGCDYESEACNHPTLDVDDWMWSPGCGRSAP